MKSKHLFLFLLLLLPVLTFLFLKFFGNNQFEIPVYYQQGVSDTLTANCDRSKEIPYRVNHALVNGSSGYTVLHFESTDDSGLKDRLESLERVQDVFWNNDAVQLFTLLHQNGIQQEVLRKYKDRIQIRSEFWNVSALDDTAWSAFRSCDLIMDSLDNRVVLVDADRRIRGYYNINEREDTDRLILELKILLSEK